MQELTELDRIHLVLALQRHTSKQKLARQVRGGLGERLLSCEHERPVPQWVPAWDDRLAVTYSRKLAFVIPPCLVFQQIKLHSSLHLQETEWVDDLVKLVKRESQHSKLTR